MNTWSQQQQQEQLHESSVNRLYECKPVKNSSYLAASSRQIPLAVHFLGAGQLPFLQGQGCLGRRRGRGRVGKRLGQSQRGAGGGPKLRPKCKTKLPQPSSSTKK